jgi:hypothetical protein
LLNVVPEDPLIACAPLAFKTTVPVLGVNVPPLFVQVPLTVKEYEPVIVNVPLELMVMSLQTAAALILG